MSVQISSLQPAKPQVSEPFTFRAAKTCHKSGFTRVTTYDVPVERVIEDADVKTTTVWRLSDPE